MTVQFDITNGCNLNCSHCYHEGHSFKDDLSMGKWKVILDKFEIFIKKYKFIPSICICGGEPLLSPILFEFINELKSRWNGVFFTLLTNGTLIEKKIEKLKKLPLIFQISIESPNEENHDKIRGLGSFKKAISGIKALKSIGMDVYIQTILTPNSSTEIEKMFEFAKSLNVNALNYTRFVPNGHGINLENSVLLKQDLKWAYKKIYDSSKKYNLKTNLDKPLYCLIDKSIGSNPLFGTQGVVVNYRGELKFSSRTNIILGNLFESSFEDLFVKHTLMLNLRDKNKSACGPCGYYNQCGGDRNLAYSVNNDILSKDPACWI